MLGDPSKWLVSRASTTLFRVGFLVRALAGGELHTAPAYAPGSRPKISSRTAGILIPDRIPYLCCRDRISHESTRNP
jgi:hypothetical protein